MLPVFKNADYLKDRQCKEKVRYEYSGEANRKNNEYNKKYGINNRVYPCYYCEGYHIGGIQNIIKQRLEI
jgi:hypothetical protein